MLRQVLSLVVLSVVLSKGEVFPSHSSSQIINVLIATQTGLVLTGPVPDFEINSLNMPTVNDLLESRAGKRTEKMRRKIFQKKVTSLRFLKIQFLSCLSSRILLLPTNFSLINLKDW